MILRKQQFRRIAHLSQSVLPHFINTQFRRTSEAVLDTPQDAVHVVLVALELKYRVDNVLQHLRSGNAAFFVDMTDQNNRCSCFFGEFQNRSRTLAHLYDAARRRVDVLRRDGLYRVDDDQIGSRILDVCENLFQRCFARYQQVVCFRMGDTVGAQFQLPCAFFARDIQHLLVREAEHCLKYQRRLSDARFTAYQRKRALYQPASQYAVQLVVAHVDALFFA